MSEPAIIYDFDPRNLPPEYLQAIGLVVAASSQTESVMRDLIGVFLRTDIIESIALGTHMSAPLKDHIARSLAELNAPSASELDTIDDLLDAVNDALQVRNTIVHNSFVIHPETGEVMSWRESARGSVQGKLVPISVKEIQQNATLVYEAGIDIIRFMESRGFKPRLRQTPLREPLDRRKKARAKRREQFGREY